LSNDAVTPTLAFGDGDSGLYESADDTVIMGIAGIARAYFSASGIQVGSAGIATSTPTATVPNLRPRVDDTDTGIGWVSADILTLIVGGQTALTIPETAGAVVFTFHTEAAAPATCAIGDFYIDTSGAYCACSATNTWSNMHATGSCV